MARSRRAGGRQRRRRAGAGGLALVVLPAAHVAGAVADCGAKGVAGVAVISAGFAEVGSAGQARQDELLELCRRHRMRLVGPNCMRVLNTDPDVSPADLLEYWEHDPRTRQILMYLEAFGDPERFMASARRVAASKPILVVKSERTARGAQAASSHTGSLAGSEAAVDSLLAQCCVLRVNTM